MLGIVIFLFFLIAGFLISDRIFADNPIYIRVWMGGTIGVLGLMWLVVPFSFIFGFSVVSHMLAIALMSAFYILVRKYYAANKDRSIKIDNVCITLLYVLIPIVLLTSVLLNGHVLAPGQDGAAYGGQSTYGDLCLHLGIITSIATQGKFPPDYSIYPGHLLSYPFLGDSLSSSLYLFGTPLRWAVLVPSYVMVILLVAGIFILAYEITKHRGVAVFSTVLFFLNGGFGFIYFMDGLRKNPSNLIRIFTAWYNTPTNYNEHFIRWSNTICDMIIPQRTSLAGWAAVIPVFWLLMRAIEKKDKKYFLYAGIGAGLLPMIHTHSFLAISVISFTWGLVYLIGVKDVKSYINKWLWFVVPVTCLALPQLIYWTFRQTSSGSGFLRLQFGWQSNEGDIWSWFWIKNIGVVFVFLIPALIAAGKKWWSIYSGPLVLFVIANLILFQPNDYDNNKLFYIWYIFSVILVSAFIFTIHNRLQGIRGRAVLLAIFIFFGCFSGVLTIGREMYSNGTQMLFDSNNLKAAEIIKANTPKDAVFLTADQHLNTVAALTGRNILSGTSLYLFFHGLDKSSRDADVERMFKDPGSFNSLKDKYNVDYVYISNFEKEKFKVGPENFANYPTLYSGGDISIFAVSDRAVKMLKQQ